MGNQSITRRLTEMPNEGQKIVAEYRGFTITEKYFKQDPYRETKDKRVRNDVGWSFSVYGVIGRAITYYTAWSHHVFFKQDTIHVRTCAQNLIDSILIGNKIEEVSVVNMPKIVQQ